MCEQCVANAHSWLEILPGYGLVRAHRNGEYLKAGDWAIVQINDPELVFNIDPSVINENFSPAASDIFTAYEVYGNFWHEMIEVARTVGYSRASDGLFELWLFERAQQLIRDNRKKKPFPIDRDFLGMDAVDPTMEAILLEDGEIAP